MITSRHDSNFLKYFVSYLSSHVDMITLKSSTVPGSQLDESLISTTSERAQKFKQVTGFQKKQISSFSTDCAAFNMPAG